MKKTVWMKLMYLGLAICFLLPIALIGCSQTTSAPSGAPSNPAASAAQESGPRYGETLRIGDAGQTPVLGYPPKVIAPRQTLPAVEKLLRFDASLKPIPWLATSFTSDASARTIALKLRQGVKFHDGTDFNAEAVKWNLEQHIAAKTAAAAKLASIDVLDDSTVRINLSAWDSTIIENLAQSLGLIVSPTAVKKNGAEWAEKNPVGTGPFQFVSWEKDVSIKYKRFDGYWQKDKPYLDAVEFVFITDTLTRQLSFKKGELDVLPGTTGKYIGELEKEGYSVTRKMMGSGAGALIPDSGNPKSPFADVRVRQALAHAIDWEPIGDAVYAGEHEGTNQWSFKDHWAHNPSVAGYPYDPAKAKQLLAEAGYPNGFKTKLFYWSNPESDQMAAAVQGYLKAVGIDVQTDPATLARYSQVAAGSGTWEGLQLSGRSGSVAFLAQLAQRYGGRGFNVQMLVPDDYRAAIESALAAPDIETQRKAVWEAQKLMVDKYALQALGHNFMDSIVSQKYARNHGLYGTADAQQWTPEEAFLAK